MNALPLCLVAALGMPASPGAGMPGDRGPSTEKERLSYAIGVDIARKFTQQSVDLDPDSLARGMKDLAAGAVSMSDEEMASVLTRFQKRMRSRARERSEREAEDNRKEGKAFLAANRGRKGVVELSSGLQYEVITRGDGPSPAATDTVVVHYRGTLVNGKEFDSSYRRGKPATFRVDGVIRGWTEALQLMPAGSRWKLYIPSELAYGSRGAGGDIGPDATLVFEVELIEVSGTRQR